MHIIGNISISIISWLDTGLGNVRQDFKCPLDGRRRRRCVCAYFPQRLTVTRPGDVIQALTTAQRSDSRQTHRETRIVRKALVGIWNSQMLHAIRSCTSKVSRSANKVHNIADEVQILTDTWDRRTGFDLKIADLPTRALLKLCPWSYFAPLSSHIRRPDYGGYLCLLSKGGSPGDKFIRALAVQQLHFSRIFMC